MRKRGRGVSWVAIVCATCKRVFQLRKCVYLQRIKTINKEPRFCTRGCMHERKRWPSDRINSANRIREFSFIRRLSAELAAKTVTTLAQMPPEKQAEMHRLYGSPLTVKSYIPRVA